VSKRQTVLIAAGLSLVYFGIQLAYLTRLPLVMDEFDGASDVYRLLSSTPYQDYRPYKTVLGYYLELPPLLLTSEVWTGLMLSKIWLAAINTGAVFAATVALSAIFSPLAALTGGLLLVSMTTFLERSSELRVDMLTAWFGLAAFVLLLKRRWLWAGVAAGVSFLVSQKGAYYIVSANAAAGVYWLCDARNLRTVRDALRMNVATAAVIAAYLVLWGLASSPATVFSATFLSHGSIAFGDLYNLEEHWSRTLEKNPLFYWGAIAGIAGLAFARWRGAAGATHLLAAVYGGVMFGLCRWHKQPWPYFFVILIPSLMVVHVAVIDVLRHRQRWMPAVAGLVLLLGVAWPFTYMPVILAEDSSYQRHVIRFAASMLSEGDTYLAGNDLIYTRAQAPRSIRRLSAPDVAAIRQWPKERLDALVGELDRTRPKLVILDYRLRSLPKAFVAELEKRYAPLWSSISTYAPLFEAGEREFDLWFDGEYLVEGKSSVAQIDGSAVAIGSMVTLGRGHHRIASDAPVRLKLQPPELAAHSDPAMRRKQALFRRVYSY
jgi:hypothetical protein